MTVERDDCCDDWPKPCAYHEGMADGAEKTADRIATLEIDNARLRAQLDSLRVRVRPEGEMMRGIWAAPAGTATHDLGADNER